MGPTEHDNQQQSPRARADQLAAALVMLGHTPRRYADPEEDRRAQQATLLAAAALPYVDSAADPARCGQPPVFAEAVQTVHGRPADPHRPVHDHLITHLGLAAQYLHALFGRVPGQERPETLRALFSFSLAILGGAAGVHDRVRSAHMGVTRDKEGRRVESVSYVFDATDLTRLARHVAETAQEFIAHLDSVAPEPERGPGRPPGPRGAADGP
jgi:hypothetical protein